MAELTSKYKDHHEYIWKCDCGGYHYIELSWDDEDPTWRYLSVADVYHEHGLRNKLKAMWTILRGRTHYSAEMLMDEKTVQEVLEVLSKHANQGQETT